MVVQWFRDLRPWARAAVLLPIAVVVLLAAGLVASRRSHSAPHAVLSPSPLASASTSSSPKPTRSPSTAVSPAPSSCAAPPGGFPGSELAAAYPVALAWSPDGRLFWAERAGTIKVLEGGAVRTFASVPTVTTEAGGGYSERGLLGLAISGSSVFAMYSNTDRATQTIVRWTDCAGVGQDQAVVASALPAGSDCCHKGGRLAISPDGHLFATIGDNHAPGAAQNSGDLRGKVIRFNLDGSGRMVWTSGLRNPFGLAFGPDGTLAVTNNGPSGDAGTPCGGCGDEFDLVGTGPGVMYEWPTCWGYNHPIGGGDCAGLGPQYSTEGGPYARGNPFFVAPTGMTWAGRFVFCAYSTRHLYEYRSQGVVADTGIGGCQLDVKQGPDGALYTSDTGAIYRH
ncbi:MAG: sorbosone dehydrogenase family protein [Candidatus Dormibacteria bacterium]